MELSVWQRVAAFAAIVAALAVLGWYLFLAPAAGAGRGTARSPGNDRHTGRLVPPAAVSPGGAQPTPVAPSVPAGSPVGHPGPAAPRANPDIYRWLPFTQAGLATAAQDAIRFGTVYGTYSYTENAAAYLRRMRGLVTPALGALLGRAYAAPGVAADRSRHKQVSNGLAVIISLRGFGPSSLIFVLAISQRMTDDRGRSQLTANYAVTLTGSGASWEVSDIQLAAAGNS